MRFLVDECLSPVLTKVAHRAGYEAHHVAYRGLSGAPDHELREVLLSEELALVTNNARDFRRLLGEAEAHPGLVIVVPNVRRDEQAVLFEVVLAYASDRQDLINCVVEVHGREDVREHTLSE